MSVNIVKNIASHLCVRMSTAYCMTGFISVDAITATCFGYGMTTIRWEQKVIQKLQDLKRAQFCRCTLISDNNS
jgi:hypothetical protein